MRCEYLKDFIYCPKCRGRFIDNNIKSKKCEACGFVYYFNPSAAVVAIIRNEKNEILVSTRGKEPAKGSLDLPGGFVDSYETAEEAVKREVAEECMLELTQTKYLFSLPNTYMYSNFEVHTLDLFYECTVKDFSGLQANDDVAELNFIAVDDIDIERFGLESVLVGLKRYIESLK